LTNINYIL